MSATAHCASTDQAKATAELANGALAMAVKAIPPLFESTDLPQEFQGLDLAAGIVQTLSRLDANVQKERVRFATRFEADFGARLAAATQKILARQADEFKTTKAQAKRIEERHMANLGRLANAMNAYHDEHGHYPPAAVAGPDGKTLHSWRVELLSYLGEQELFASYNLDEPWDSEHNKQLIAKMPPIYGATDRAQQGNADYFVVTGKGTLFDRDSLPTRGSVADAAGETILLAQCPYQWTPWTRPEDIDYSADEKPPRPFRGRGEAFYAAFVDGTVRFVPRRSDPGAVRPRLTKAAGDKVKLR